MKEFKIGDKVWLDTEIDMVNANDQYGYYGIIDDMENTYPADKLIPSPIAKIKERIRLARIMRGQTVLRPSVKTRRAMLYVIIQENKKLLKLLKGENE